MKRSIAAASTMVCTIALIAVAAMPASAAVPGGQGLVSFGFANCGELGVAELLGPPAGPAASGYLVIPEQPGVHVVSTRFELTLNGEVVFSKNFGEKVGVSTFTCTQTFEDPEEGTGVFSVTVAVVPPR